jgi:Domain of unknown function (DUF4277)
MIDARLGPDAQEERTPGEALAGRLRTGVGFAHTPRTLTPQFCAHTPLALLLRAGVHAAMCHRWPRGRTLEAGQA